MREQINKAQSSSSGCESEVCSAMSRCKTFAHRTFDFVMSSLVQLVEFIREAGRLLVILDCEGHRVRILAVKQIRIEVT
jgi:hypothetical protein